MNFKSKIIQIILVLGIRTFPWEPAKVIHFLQSAIENRKSKRNADKCIKY